MTKEECEIETSKAIMEMRSRIAELEKENAELKARGNKKKHGIKNKTFQKAKRGTSTNAKA